MNEENKHPSPSEKDGENLISLSDFITKIDKEFPNAMDKSEMQDLVIKKYKQITSYNRFLQQPLTIEMFEGESSIFKGGRYNDIQPSTNWNYYSIHGMKIFQDRNGVINGALGLKVKDLCKLNIKTYGRK